VNFGDHEAMGGEVESGGCRGHRLVKFSAGRMNESWPRGLSDQGPIRAEAPEHHDGARSNDQRSVPSIREPQSVARLSRTFSRSLSAVDLGSRSRRWMKISRSRAART
jgi:hypothetical protein